MDCDLNGENSVRSENDFAFLKACGNVQLDTHVVRYMSKDRFLEMIESQVNTLAHISLWEDPFEAFLVRSDIEVKSSSGDDDSVRRLYDFYKYIYAQSWTMKHDESDVFWRAYGKRGETVRIETTVGKLCKSLLKISHGCQCNAIRVAGVDYKSNDEIKEMFSEDGLCRQITSGLLESFFIKRKEFADERELRIVACPKHDTLDMERDRNGSLLKFSIEPDKLIEAVLLDPCMGKRQVEEIKCRVMHRYPDMRISQSSLFEWPTGFSRNRIEIPEENERCFWRLFKASYRNGQSEFTNMSITSRRYWGFKFHRHLGYYVTFNQNCARAELYIDSPDMGWNKRVFDQIHALNPHVAERFDRLKWERLDDRRASRISLENANLSFCRHEDWNTAIQWLCEALDELRRVFPEEMLGGITQQ